MYNPNCFRQPSSTQDSTYLQCSGTADHGGVHTNSGVANQFFALLTDGGNLNSVAVSGIGITKAFHITMRALFEHLTASSTFSQFATAVATSCSELKGATLKNPKDGSNFGQTISQSDCDAVNNALSATAMSQALCSSGSTPDSAVDLFAGFPPVGDVGEPPYTTVFLLSYPVTGDISTFNPVCRIFTDNTHFTDQPGVLYLFELVFMFACETPQSDFVGSEVAIQVAADGVHFSEFAFLFTYISSADPLSVSPSEGSTSFNSLTKVTIKGSDFEEFTGCNQFENADANGEVYDCLTCVFGDLNYETPVKAKLIDSSTIECVAPSFYSLVHADSNTVQISVSKNAQIYIINPDLTFTYVPGSSDSTLSSAWSPRSSVGSSVGSSFGSSTSAAVQNGPFPIAAIMLAVTLFFLFF